MSGLNTTYFVFILPQKAHVDCAIVVFGDTNPKNTELIESSVGMVRASSAVLHQGNTPCMYSPGCMLGNGGIVNMEISPIETQTYSRDQVMPLILPLSMPAFLVLVI